MRMGRLECAGEAAAVNERSCGTQQGLQNRTATGSTKYQQKSVGCGRADSLAHGVKDGLPRCLCRHADVSRLVRKTKRLKQGIIFPVVNSSAELTDMVDEYWDLKCLPVGGECIDMSCHWDSRSGDKEA